ncbi:hypothetical protein GXW82_07290 [Streptacidiphilus sp. 4-A2]|nr:hypothetical protein [Streptacidiphilus sp. 4-A2]
MTSLTGSGPAAAADPVSPPARRRFALRRAGGRPGCWPSAPWSPWCCCCRWCSC